MTRIIKTFDIQVDKWAQPYDDISNRQIGVHQLHVTLALQPEIVELPKHYHITVFLEKKVMDILKDTEVLDTFTQHHFLIENQDKKYTVEFIFSCIEIAVKTLSDYWDEQIKNTRLVFHKIEKQNIKDHKEYIEENIRVWEAGTKNQHLN